MTQDLTRLAIEIIQNNQYMTISSADTSGNSWASPVAYSFDNEFNFYWVSVPDSKHQKNIKINPKITFSIFDSHQLWGEGVGVQIEALATEVSIMDYPHVLDIYFSRQYPYGNVIGSFGKGLRELLKGNIYHFYCAKPTRVWVPDPDADVDSRVEVQLNSSSDL